MHFFSSTYSKKGVKRTFDFSGRSLHPDIPPAKERIKDYKRKILEVNDNSEFERPETSAAASTMAMSRMGLRPNTS